MRPRAQVLVDGEPLFGGGSAALVSVTVTDEEGIDSDTVEVVFDEGRGPFAIPPDGARIEVRMGFEEHGLVHMGSFAKDGAGGAGPVAELTLFGTAVDLGSPLRAPRSRVWEDVTLADLVADLAAEAGLTPVVSPQIAATAYAVVAQQSESALNLLTRLSRPLDAAAKAADGRLVVAKLGTGLDATGAPMEAARIAPADLTGWTWSEEARDRYARVEATWRDAATGIEDVAVAGAGDPSKTLRPVFATRDEAMRAARAELNRSARGAIMIDCEGRFRPELFAGGLVELDGLRPNLDGRAEIVSVTHSLGGALVTSVRLRRTAPDA
ncbi:MAG: phage late control D family protein [Paracoccaceae bacterium]